MVSFSFLLLLIVSLPITKEFIDIRLFRIPIGYIIFLIPYIYTALTLKRIKIENTLLILGFCFISYIIIRSLIELDTLIPTLQYIIMWCIYLSILIFLSNIPADKFHTWLKDLNFSIYIICLAIVISVLKKFMYNLEYANPFPILDRNLVGITLVIMFNIFLYLSYIFRFSKVKFMLIFIVFTIGILFLLSRTAVLGFSISLFIYLLLKIGKYRIKFGKVYLKYTQILKYSFLIIFFLTTFISIYITYKPLANRIEDAFSGTEILWSVLVTKELHYYDILRSQNISDKLRLATLIQGLFMVKKYFVFGTGPGLYNYLKKLDEENYYVKLVPHNFYISFLSQYGVVGSLIFASLLFNIFRKLLKLSYPYKHMFLSVIIVFFIMISFNEYITLPLIWYLMGLGIAKYKLDLIKK